MVTTPTELADEPRIDVLAATDLQHEEAQQVLAANVIRPVTLVEHAPPT